MQTKSDSFQRQPSIIDGAIQKKDKIYQSMSSVIKGASTDPDYLRGKEQGEQKNIDFKKLMQQYRARTEIDMPYSMMKVEDAMFVDKKYLVALEYIFYDISGRNEPKYYRLHEVKGQISLLGLKDYVCDQNEFPVNAFVSNVQEAEELQGKMKHLSFDPKRYYFDEKHVFRKHGQNDSQDKDYNPDDDTAFVLEPVISLWKIDKHGNLVKKLQRSFQSEHDFSQSRDGQRMLTLSQDRSIVTLGIVDRDNHFSLKAWNVRDLKEIELKPALLQNLKKATKDPERKFESIKYVCKSQYLMLVQKSPLKMYKENQESDKGNKYEFTIYSFFRAFDGQLVLEFSNNSALEIDDLQDQEAKDKAYFRCLGLLVPEKMIQEKVQDHKLSFVFFFASPSKEEDSRNWEVTFIEMTLLEIQQQQKSQFSDLKNPNEIASKYIMSLGWSQRTVKKKVQDFGKFILPESWFVEENPYKKDNRDQPYEQKTYLSFKNIQIAANESFTDFGFFVKGQYYAFMNRHAIGLKLGTTRENFDTVQTQPDQPVKYFLHESEMGSIARNQQCKKFLFLMIRVKNGGSEAICFFPEKNRKKSIKFKKDHLHAQHDVQTQEPEVKAEQREGIALWDRFMLQSLTLSDNDQQILLQTQKIQSKDLQDIKNVLRKSINQRHSGHYPIFAYNLGLKTLVVQNTQKENMNFIYELPEKETFVSFVEYRKFEDIGFYPSNLKIEMCSNLVFLSKKGDQTFVNVLLIDPYHVQNTIQFAILQSIRSLDCGSGLDMHRDTIIKTLMYSTKKKADQISFEIKVLTQYTESFTQEELTFNWRKDENSDQSESSDDSAEDSDEYNQLQENQSTITGLEPVPIIISPQGIIYYVIGSEGNCIVKQLNPASDYREDHLSVFEDKSESCLGFCTSSGDEFYFVDQNRNITKLERNPETKGLLEVGRLIVKDKDLHSLDIGRFANLIIEDKYLISQSRIFYLNSPTPLMNGILDMEDLSRSADHEGTDGHGEELGEEWHADGVPVSPFVARDTGQAARSPLADVSGARRAPFLRKCVDGPFRFRGSSQFLLVFQSGQSQHFHQRVYQLPDSSSVSLINDQERRAEFSTFLDNSRILLQVSVPGPIEIINHKEHHSPDGARFAVFTEEGKFLSSVQFEATHSQHQGQVMLSMAKGSQAQVPKEQQYAVNITGSDRMHFVAMSNSNEYFLFQDTQAGIYTVYTLVSSGADPGGEVPSSGARSPSKSRRMAALNASNTGSRPGPVRHFFRPVFEVGMAPYMATEEPLTKKDIIIDGHMEQRKQASLGKESCPWDVTVTDEGRVILLSHTTDGPTDPSGVAVERSGAASVQAEGEAQRRDVISYNVRGVIFAAESNQSGTGEAMTPCEGQPFERGGASFDRGAVREILASIKKAKLGLERQLTAERQAQRQLPRNFRDDTRARDLQRQLREEERREETIVHQYIFGDLLIVFCGRHIKYTWIGADSSKQLEPSSDKYPYDSAEPHEWLRAAVDFDAGVDIEKIYETSKRNWLQIIARETVRNVLIVLTWNFNENIEASMFQLNCLPGTVPENYVVRGLNQKLNYFVDQHQIYDLELNIPCQESTNNKVMVKGIPSKYAESRQIYEDASRALCINHANLLNFPLTRMDLVLWRSIAELGEHQEHIKSNTELVQFNQRFDENSLFHYFASNIQVIEMLHKRFKDAKQNNQLTKADESMPLIMLYPNKAKQTALDIALDAQVPKAFELLIDLLEPFDSVFISKMLLNCLPFMVSMSSEYILRFFASSVYRSSMMEVGCYPWDDHWAQINFTCHTTFVSPEIIRREIQRQRYSFHSLWLRWGKTGRKSIQNEELLPSSSDGQMAETSGEIYKRIKVEAIDLDWIFQHENTKNFIMLLAQCEQSEIFLQQSIRVFVEIIWEQYQPAIIKAIFLPYCVYLLLLVSLTSKYAGEFLDTMSEPEEQAGEGREGLELLEGLSGTCALLLAYFMWIEGRQLYEEKSRIRYFQDYWNYFDLASVALNLVFLVMLFQEILYETGYSRDVVKKVRLVGALAVFIMWIKIFYWMRLFRIFAHFISLLSQTARDISTFTVMLFLILAAFANFFYIINNNTPGGNPDYRETGGASYHYVDTYVHNAVIDSLIAVYLMCLGEFDVGGYSQGPNQYAAWLAFVLATFIVLVVFMNIIIAIMTESFSKVEQTKEQLQLEEQLQLVKDYIWLLDLKETFKGKKYIIKLTPDMSSHTESENVFDQVQELTKEIIKKSEATKDQVYENNDVLEKQIRTQINQFKERLSVMLDQVFRASNQNADKTI